MSRVGFLVLLFSVAAVAQQPQTPAPQHRQDVIDQAHRDLFQPPPDKKKSASEITAQLSGSLPSAPRSQPVPRRTPIDYYVFARMEKDGVPHAPLASDEEF